MVTTSDNRIENNMEIFVFFKTSSVTMFAGDDVRIKALQRNK
jgi:hypothetical protein